MENNLNPRIANIKDGAEFPAVLAKVEQRPVVGGLFTTATIEFNGQWLTFECPTDWIERPVSGQLVTVTISR